MNNWLEALSLRPGQSMMGFTRKNFYRQPAFAFFLLVNLHLILLFSIQCFIPIQLYIWGLWVHGLSAMIIYTSGLLLGGGVTRKWRMGQVWESKPFYTISIFSSMSPQCLLRMWLSPIPDSLQSFRDKIIWFLVSVTIQSRNRNHIRSVNRDKK